MSIIFFFKWSFCLAIINLSVEAGFDGKQGIAYNQEIKICDAFHVSAKNLTGKLVIFVNVFNHIGVPDYYNSFLTFYECYAEPAGMKLLYFNYLRNSNDTCQFFKNKTYSRFEGFHFNKTFDRVEVILPEVSINKCDFTNITNDVMMFINHFKSVFSSKDVTYGFLCGEDTCAIVNETANKYGVLLDEKPSSKQFYEHLEILIDEGLENKTNATNETRSYFYFQNGFSRTRAKVLWPAILTTLVFMCFLICGCLSCVQVLLNFSLIEEDFLRRNDEMEWMENLDRRRQPQSPIIIFNEGGGSNLQTAISGSSTTSVVETDSTQGSADTAISRNVLSNSTTVGTDVTQNSELLSGTDASTTTTIQSASETSKKTV